MMPLIPKPAQKNTAARTKTYPLCACGCNKQTTSHSICVGFPHFMGEAKWAATEECAAKLRKKPSDFKQLVQK
jgi:hypothetical protein